jgi:hypothetical protein
MSIALERHSSEVRANQFLLLACSYVQIPRSTVNDVLQPTSGENTEFVGRSVVSGMSSSVVSLVDNTVTSSTGLPVRYDTEWPGDGRRSSEHLCFFCQSQEAESKSPSTF